jgi:anti-anti-sigma factor
VVEGEVERASIPELDQAITTFYAQRPDVVLDLRGVSFIDTGGARYLFQASEALEAGGRHLTLLVSNPHIERLLGLLDPDGDLDVRLEPSAEG